MFTQSGRVTHKSGVALATVVLSFLFACESKQVVDPVDQPAEPAVSLFDEVSEKVGLHFQHYSGASGKWHVPEILGSGVALLDYDLDGDLDVYFVQSNDFFNAASSDAELFPLPADQSPGHKLFANQIIPSGRLTFKDVTEASGLAEISYGMGVAVADYDNDGDPDMYVTSYGNNAFYKNNLGKFEKMKDAAGAQDASWSTSASFCDVNNDQLADLYVSNYLDYSSTDQTVCRDSLGQQDYCGPQSYSGASDALFINTGQGGFVDRSKKWGIKEASSTGLGVSCRDFNQNGTNDVYVANDAMPNLLWLNDDHQSFDEQGQLLGAAINVNGMSEGSMGIAAGDYDGDGDDDVFITHWNNETNTLYRNDLNLGFIDVTRQANLATASLSHTGFGTEFLDIDNDGDLDVFVANGAVQRYIDGRGVLSRNYGQKNQVFINSGKGRFENAGAEAGAATQMSFTGRGAAFGDIDNDGDTDVVVSNKDAKARLFVNQVGQSAQWLGIDLQGSRSQRDALGAEVRLTLGDQTLRRTVRTDGSYLSASDPRIVFGLGETKAAQSVEVRWPSGHIQVFTGLEVGRYHTLVEGGSQ
ncbi:MAG: CRTAC1 family protein [Gammaproteobacteria bacterium]